MHGCVWSKQLFFHLWSTKSLQRANIPYSLIGNNQQVLGINMSLFLLINNKYQLNIIKSLASLGKKIVIFSYTDYKNFCERTLVIKKPLPSELNCQFFSNFEPI